MVSAAVAQGNRRVSKSWEMVKTEKLSTEALGESWEETIHCNNGIAFIKTEVLSQENKLLL